MIPLPAHGHHVLGGTAGLLPVADVSKSNFWNLLHPRPSFLAISSLHGVLLLRSSSSAEIGCRAKTVMALLWNA
eukprot:3551146-Pyramimonas_sp.AAC.1